MKRDFDLIRKILSTIEEARAGDIITKFSFDGVEPAVVTDHLRMLISEGFVEGELPDRRYHRYIIRGLTWKGHDFCDAMKDETLWAKAQETILKPIGGMTFDLLLAWLKAQMATKLGLPSG